ncbi:MAG: SAM-dependent methyltransferase [Acidiferrobacterales bacterium]
MNSQHSHPRFLLLSISLISAVAIGYEILLMRVLSIVQWHHFAYMIISLALLGYGVSGTFLAIGKQWLQKHFVLVYVSSAGLFGTTMIACFALSQHVPFNALEVVWDPHQFVYLIALYILFFVPFFFAASCIGLAFIRYKEIISRIYFSDLLGAGSGAVVIVLALFVLRPEDCLKLFAAFALLSAILLSLERALRWRGWIVTVLVVYVAVLLFALPQSWSRLRISPYKGVSQATQVLGTKVVSEHSNPLGLLTVVESATIPFRHAPGLSLNAQVEPPPQLAMFTDGDAMSVITHYDGKREKLAYLDSMTTALPYHLLDRPNVLILGAGGGTDVLLARYHQASAVTAVELNPLVVQLVRKTYADFSGNLYSADGVDIHIGEARGFVARSSQKYDLIQVALLDSFAASSAGVHALSESYLYTVEAIQQYLHHLTPGGILAITRWLKLPPRDSIKLFATATLALSGTGVREPARHLTMIRSWKTSTLLIKNSELTMNDIVLMREFCRVRSFDVAYYPGMPANEANQYNLLDKAYLFDAATALLGDDRRDFIERYKFHIVPATDDKPHFFHFFKWRVLPELLALRERGGAALIEWGYLILIATLVQAVVAGAIFILLPLWMTKRGWHRHAGTRMGLYFFALGIAFLFIEIAFIQKFILFLHHPLYAVAVVLSGFLVFAGLGSGYSKRLASRLQDTAWSPITVAVIGIIAIASVYLLFLPEVSNRLVALPDSTRVTLSLGLIAPLAFCMGMPFPLGLERVAAGAPDFIPWAWGLNGFASVLSAVLATLAAIHFGFTTVVGLALGLYALAAIVIHKPL